MTFEKLVITGAILHRTVTCFSLYFTKYADSVILSNKSYF